MDGGHVEIIHHLVYELDADGKQLSCRQLTDYTGDKLRTLGLKKLDAITVPVPPLDRQLWFDRLQRQVRQVEMLRESVGEDVEGLLPAMLHGVFRD